MAHIRPISGKPHVGNRLRAETGPTITASLGHCRIPTAGRHGIPVVDRKWADLLCCVGGIRCGRGRTHPSPVANDALPRTQEVDV